MMKNILLASTVCGSLLVAQINAEAPSPLKDFQFYMGMSGGMEKMAGQRGESFDEEDINAPPGRIITTYTNNLEMSARYGVGSLMAGFLWKIPKVPLLIGPEIYVGSGGATSSFSDARFDPFFGNENRLYSTNIQRKLFSGALIRFGYQFFEKYLAYLSFGLDRSQFAITRSILFNPAVSANVIKRTKTINGVLFGIGLERAFDQFVVGFDFRKIQYRKYNSVDDVRVVPGVTPAFLNLVIQPRINIFSVRIAYRF